MSDTTLRYLETLLAIPRHPRKISAAEVHLHLEAAGYSIDRRSVERDLQKLSIRFAIACDEGTKPQGWYWRAHAEGLAAPGTTLAEALELDLLARYLKPILPVSSWSALEPRLNAARAQLRTLANAPLARWRSRVAVIEDGPPLLAPQVPTAVQDAVHEALLKNRVLEIDYHSADSDSPKRFEVHPVALVHQGRVGYLVTMLYSYTDLRLLALHRMSKPVVRDQPARQAASFDLREYLEQEQDFGFPSGRNLRLQLRVSDWLARHLRERPLSQDQTITPTNESAGHLVRATVPESERLVWWLRSHGEAVEVLKPAALRRRFAEEFRHIARYYSKDHLN
jgi:predicted DNA-binding transcriptional regulator YafY